MPIPDFDSRGLLPVGTFSATFGDVRKSQLVTGAGQPTWDVAWRAKLVDNAEVLVQQLWDIGVTEIFLDGSFVEAKPHPNDIDGYFECDARDFAKGAVADALNAVDPYKVWTWTPSARKAAPGSTKRQLPMWHRYRVEFYPHFRGLMSGIVDQFGNELPFPAAFRQQRGTGARKGIVRIIR
jgi:hypothetical protein